MIEKMVGTRRLELLTSIRWFRTLLVQQGFRCSSQENLVIYSSCASGICALNASTGAKLWRYATGTADDGFGVLSSPAVIDGVVYNGGGGEVLYALNADTGAKQWSPAAFYNP